MVCWGILTDLENNNRVIPCQVNTKKSMASSDLDETW